MKTPSLTTVQNRWHYLDAGERNTDQIAYVGISDVSIVIELRDGTYIRATNPDKFTDGLKIERRVKNAHLASTG
jgi:hypothetical protein